MSNNQKEKRIFRKFFLNQVLIVVIFISLTILLYTVDKIASLIMFITAIVYAILGVAYFYFRKPNIIRELVQLATNYSQTQKKVLKELAIPYGLLDYDGRMLWGNDEFHNIIVNERQAGLSITNIISEVRKEDFPTDINDVKVFAEKNDKYYKIVLRKLSFDDIDFHTGDGFDVEIGRAHV